MGVLLYCQPEDGALAKHEPELLRLSTEPERSRALHQLRGERGREFLLSRLLVRVALHRLTGGEQHEWCLEGGRHVPLLASCRDCGREARVSISRTDGLVAAGAEFGHLLNSLGVDVETHADIDWNRIGNHFLTDSQTTLARRAESLGYPGYYATWVLVEAYAKCTREGIGTLPREFPRFTLYINSDPLLEQIVPQSSVDSVTLISGLWIIPGLRYTYLAAVGEFQNRSAFLPNLSPSAITVAEIFETYLKK